MASELWLRADIRNVLLGLCLSYAASSPDPHAARIYASALLSAAVAFGVSQAEAKPLQDAALGHLLEVQGGR